MEPQKDKMQELSQMLGKITSNIDSFSISSAKVPLLLEHINLGCETIKSLGSIFLVEDDRILLFAHIDILRTRVNAENVAYDVIKQSELIAFINTMRGYVRQFEGSIMKESDDFLKALHTRCASYKIFPAIDTDISIAYGTLTTKNKREALNLLKMFLTVCSNIDDIFAKPDYDLSEQINDIREFKMKNILGEEATKNEDVKHIDNLIGLFVDEFSSRQDEFARAVKGEQPLMRAMKIWEHMGAKVGDYLSRNSVNPVVFLHLLNDIVRKLPSLSDLEEEEEEEETEKEETGTVTENVETGTVTESTETGTVTESTENVEETGTESTEECKK
jgi:hypothetical protein